MICFVYQVSVPVKKVLRYDETLYGFVNADDALL